MNLKIEVEARTRRWLEKAVIGLGLCPFAAPVLEKNQIRFVVSVATDTRDLDSDLRSELNLLKNQNSAATTLLICPHVLIDFVNFNLYLKTADAILKDLELVGQIQIASFHPDYQFAGSAPADIENFTNRAPYPILHLLREKDVEEALKNFSDPDGIYRKNVETMRRLGHQGLEKLMDEIKGESPK